MTKKTLKFNNIKVNKKKSHMPEEPINLMSVNLDQVVVSDKFNNNSNKNIIIIIIIIIIMMVLDILLVTKKVKLLSHYVLFYLKWVGI